MQAQLSQATRERYPALTSALFPQPITFSEMIAAKGIDEAKARRNLNRQLRYRANHPGHRNFPSGYAHTADYISRFCSINHLKEC